jgi:mannose-1-phosphate guanylyltransferase
MGNIVRKKKSGVFKAVILAGGSGERFWPLSTAKKPKQFLRVFGGESLIRQSVQRLGDEVPPENVFVVGAKNLIAATRKELPELPKGNIVGEPLRRDTAAAVALGVALASVGEDDPVIGIFSSDQLVTDVKSFRKTLFKAVALAERRDSVVTIGIRPTYPATCFGYISPETRRFVEKPDVKKARSYIKAGYLWNAGMFIARSSVFRAAFAEYAPELSALASPRGGAAPVRSLAKIYQSLPKISFDYAIMERLDNIEVVPGDFGWDDVGSFAAFDKYFPRDARGNVREGPCTVVDSGNNICVVRGAGISLLGVNNLVVITTPDAVLVADKSHLTEMKKLFSSR